MLNEKVVIVTGGAGCLGHAFVRAIAAHGGIAIVADRNTQAAACVVEEVVAHHPGHAVAVTLDITEISSISAMITQIQAQYGCIDAVVNNAYPRNSQYGRALENVTYSDFCENVSQHVGGYFLVAQQLGLFFRAHGKGNIINMASIYGTMAPRFEIYEGTSMTMPVEYAAIKSAIIQLTRYFAQYFKEDGIRVNCISPGGIVGHQPEAFQRAYNAHCGAKGMMDPCDVTGALLFLLSDASRYITGQNMIIDDGFTL